MGQDENIHHSQNFANGKMQKYYFYLRKGELSQKGLYNYCQKPNIDNELENQKHCPKNKPKWDDSHHNEFYELSSHEKVMAEIHQSVLEGLEIDRAELEAHDLYVSRRLAWERAEQARLAKYGFTWESYYRVTGRSEALIQQCIKEKLWWAKV